MCNNAHGISASISDVSVSCTSDVVGTYTIVTIDDDKKVTSIDA